MDMRWFDLETRAPADADDGEVARWYAERFGAVPAIGAVVEDLDAAVAELRALGTEVEDPRPGDDGGRVAVATGPSGLRVDVIETTPVAEQERSIGEFIATAEPLAGAPTGELADAALAIVVDAWDRIAQLLDGVAHDKVLATQLLLGQLARSGPPPTSDSPDYWRRSAASTLVSGFVVRGARQP